jgi:hypothetical protein
MMGRSNARVLSRPCRVFFAGFETTTTQLQQQGWELSVEQDISRFAIRLALRFQPARLYMVSNPCEYDFFREADRGGFGDHLPEFHIRYCASNFTVQLAERSFNFRSIDAVPTYTEAPRKSIDDFGIFAAPLVRTEEIVVEPDTVSDLLAKIKAMQAPELAALRERNRRRHEDPGSMDHGLIQPTRFHAQIVSLAA